MAICCTKDSLINIATTAVLNFVVFDMSVFLAFLSNRTELFYVSKANELLKDLHSRDFSLSLSHG
jgi:hypothetical protein